MRSMRLAAQRSRAQTGLLATVGAVSLVLTALVVGLIGYLNFASTVTTRAFVEQSESTARSIRLEAKMASDPTAQTVAVESFLRSEFSDVSVSVYRTLANFPLPASRVNVAQETEKLTLPSGSEARITTTSDAQLDHFATVIDGEWPTVSTSDGSAEHPLAGALQADAAQQLDLSVGDTLTIGKGSDLKFVTIVTTWRATDAHDAHWFSDPSVATGVSVAAGDGTQSFGPLVLDENALVSLGPVPIAQWTVALMAQELTPDQLDHAGAVASRLADRAAADEKIGGGVTVNGALSETARSVHASIESVRGVTPVGILLVALVALIALVQLARLLSLARRPENALLRSRGASAQWLTTAGTIEAALFSSLGSTLGFAAATGTLCALFGPAAVPFAPWEIAALTAVAIVTIFGATAFFDAIRLAQRDAVDDSGRARTTATAGAALLASAAAGVAVWQSLLYGSPLITDAAGRTSVNPLAVVAPTLALIAASLVVLVIFSPITAALQHLAARRPRLQPAYSARHIAGGIGSYAVAVLVVVLAFGGLVVAAGYSGSWNTLSERSGALIAGADARVALTASTFPLASSTAETGAEFLSVPGVTGTAPVLTTPISIGDNDEGSLTAIPVADITHIVGDGAGAINPSSLQGALTGFTFHGVELPPGSTSVSLTATVTVTTQNFTTPSSTYGTIQSSLWFQNENGAIVTVPFERVTLDPLAPAGAKTTLSLNVDLPASDSPWWLTAIDYSVRAEGGWVLTSFHDLKATTASGTQQVSLETEWGDSQLFSNNSTTSNFTAGVLTVGLPGEGGRTGTVRMMATNPTFEAGQFVSYGQPLLIVVNEELAARYDLKVGDPFQLRFSGSGITVYANVTKIVPLLPGIQSANSVLMDLNALTDFILRSSTVVPRANQIWLATKGHVDLTTALPEGATLVTPTTAIDSRFAAPAELALWIAAIGCLLLAAISLGAVTLTVARARRGEIAVLRAVGIAAGQQARWRWAELTAVILLSALFGVLSGLVVSVLTVQNLARSAVQGATKDLPVTLTFALVTGGALLLASLLVMLTIAAMSAARVRSVALDTSERLETR